MTDAPHPWTYHDPGETDAVPRITDDNGDEVTLGRAWREVQRLQSALWRLCPDHGPGYEGVHGLGCDCPE